jgi:hypothetical protein
MKHQTPLAGGYHGSGDLTIVAYRASYAVVLEARQPVDRAAHNGPQASFSFVLTTEEQDRLQ